MKRRKSIDPVRKRLLDLWYPPSSAGEPIAALATSYTFDADFFETQCLSRFLRLESDPTEQRAAYLVEREERLRDSWAGVILDADAMDDSRAASWDLLSVRVPGGIMHAKVALLAWSHLVRIIIGSANLTTPGYRSNLEVAGVLDIKGGAPSPVEASREVLEFSKELVAAASERTAATRAHAALDRVAGLIDNLASTVSSDTSKNARPVFVGPDRPPLLEQLEAHRPAAHGVWRKAKVISPFFDDDAAPAVRALEAKMAQRGETSMHFVLDGALDADDIWALRAPNSLGDARADAVWRPVDREMDGDERVLHAKTLTLGSTGGWTTYIGSSNFSRRGLGLGPRNIEAGLVYALKDEDAADVVPALDAVPRERVRLIPSDPDDLDGPRERSMRLPPGFCEALHAPGELIFRLDPPRLPSWWSIAVDAKSIASSEDPDAGTTELRRPYAPDACSIVDVTWRDHHGEDGHRAWWVNVMNRSQLPDPELLKNLDLTTLLEVLSGGRPLHLVLAHRDSTGPTGADMSSINPHDKVDTETFILKQARRFAQALEGLEARLAQPCYSRTGLDFRVRGPVGPLRLAAAVLEAEYSADQTAFSLAEIALSCGRVHPQSPFGALPAREVRAALSDAIGQLESHIRALPDLGAHMSRYVTDAVREARR